MSTIRNLLRSIDAWNGILGRLGEPIKGEFIKVTERCKEYLELVANAKEKIEMVDAIHGEVTKRHTIPDQRVIGFLLHFEKIEVSARAYGFTKDWALIELYDEKIDWSSFKLNKVYVGKFFSISLSPSLIFISRRAFISRLLIFSFSRLILFFSLRRW